MEVHRAILQKNRNSFNCELKNYAEKHDKSDVNTELALTILKIKSCKVTVGYCYFQLSQHACLGCRGRPIG